MRVSEKITVILLKTLLRKFQKVTMPIKTRPRKENPLIYLQKILSVQEKQMYKWWSNILATENKSKVKAASDLTFLFCG